jgi:hypothetical protein
MGAGLLLAGVQLAATAALLPQTMRADGLLAADKVRWSLAPARLLEWIVPGLARGPMTAIPVDAAGGWPELPFAESVYLGVPLVAAAALGVTARSGGAGRRTALLLGGAAAVLLWLAMGQHLGARQALDWVPVWSRFRYAEKLMAPLSLVLVALAARGIDRFGEEGLAPAAARALSAVAIAAGVALLVLLAAPAATEGAALRLLGDAGALYRARLAAGLPHLLIAAAALLAIDRLAGTRRGQALALLVPLSAAAALSAGVHFGAPEVRRAATPLRLEAEAPGPRIGYPTLHVTSLTAPDNVEYEGERNYVLLYPAVNAAHRLDSLANYGPFEPGRYGALRDALGDRWVLSLGRFGLTHFVQGIPYGAGDVDLVAHATAGARLVQRDAARGFKSWEVPHRPWAFFAELAVATPAAARARKVVEGLVSRGADGTVVVETGLLPPVAPGRVLGVERGTERVRVEAESEGPALLVVQDAFWPGWRATVDGEPVEILPADAWVRAVRWPAGRHRLEMRYEPPELRLGLALSALGALAIGLLAVRWRRPAVNGRSPEATPPSGRTVDTAVGPP